MAGAFVLTFDVDGDSQIARGFSRFADNVKDLRPAFKEMAKDFREGEKRQFATEGGYGAGGWEPLAPATLERKGRGGYPSAILVRIGALKESLTGGAQGIEEIRPLVMRLGTKIDYAIFHQRGTGTMPARPLIMLPEEQKTRWHKFVHKFLVQEMKKAF